MSENKQIHDLGCKESIESRKSPELWPEKVPGAWDMNKALTVGFLTAFPKNCWACKIPLQQRLYATWIIVFLLQKQTSFLLIAKQSFASVSWLINPLVASYIKAN